LLAGAFGTVLLLWQAPLGVCSAKRSIWYSWYIWYSTNGWSDFIATDDCRVINATLLPIFIVNISIEKTRPTIDVTQGKRSTKICREKKVKLSFTAPGCNVPLYRRLLFSPSIRRSKLVAQFSANCSFLSVRRGDEIVVFVSDTRRQRRTASTDKGLNVIRQRRRDKANTNPDILIRSARHSNFVQQGRRGKTRQPS